MNLLVRLGNYISTKPKFIKASIWMFGVPFGIFMAVFTYEYKPWLPVLFLLLAPGAGYLWGLVMWHVHFEAIYARRAKSASGQGDGR